MAGPWDAFKAQDDKPSAKPWEAFAGQEEKKPERGFLDLAFGLTGERVKTWPERAVREALTLPKRMIDAAYSAPPGSREATEAMVPVAAETALTMSPVNPAIRAGDRVIPGAAKAFREQPAAIPTTQELAESGGAAIQAGRQSDLVINPAAVADFSKRVQQGIRVHPIEAPATFAKLKELETPAAGAIFTPNDLQVLRESLGKTAQNFNPNFAQDQLAATRAIGEFDDFLRSISPKDTMVRPAAGQSAPATREQLVAQAMSGKREAERVADLFERGRGDYAAAMRSNDITGVLDRARTGLLERAEGRAKAAHSGRNMDNTLRQKTEAILEKPKEISGYSDAELAALEHVVEGGAGRNLARNVGNKLGGGGGAAQTIFAGAGAGAGAAMGGWPGAVIGAAIPATVGSGARSIANALAKRDLRKVDELLRQRSPLYSERLANPNMTPVSAEARAAIARALMAGQLGE